MSTLKTHNLQSPDAGSVNIALASNAGIVVTGISTFNNDVNFTGANGYNAIWDKSADHLRFEDNAKACFGSSTDLQLWHNGSHSNIKNSTGRLYILADDIWIKDGNDGDIHARFLHDDACELYFDGGKKLETTNTGITVTGTVSATSFTGDGSNLTNLPPSAPVGGSASNKVFFENDKVVSVNYQITSTKNAMTAGPVTINSGIGVTVPSGCAWTIV